MRKSISHAFSSENDFFYIIYFYLKFKFKLYKNSTDRLGPNLDGKQLL